MFSSKCVVNLIGNRKPAENVEVGFIIKKSGTYFSLSISKLKKGIKCNGK